MPALRRALYSTVGACGLLIAANGLAMADFPERTVEINTGASPGGTGDTLARLVAQNLSEKWGRSVVVVNRPGANHRIAAEYVAHADPDGYTMLALTIELMLPDPPGVDVTYNLLEDFAPVTLVATAPNCLVVNASLPVDTLQDLIELARAEPDRLNIAVVGTGGLAEEAMHRLLLLTGTTMEFLHYQGSALGMAAVLSDEAQVTHLPCAGALSHLEAGTIKVLAITQKSDVPLLASVPTFEEASGLEGYDGGGSNRYGLAVPAGTPEDVVLKMRQDIQEILSRDTVRQQLAQSFIFPADPEDDFGALIRREIPRWQEWTAESDSLATQ